MAATVIAPGQIQLAAVKPAARQDPGFVRWGLITVGVCFLGLFLILPMSAVFLNAFGAGFSGYWAAITQPDTLSAVRLTLIAALIAVPLNVVFGLAASWCIARFEFTGKQVLLALIDVPFTVSPVISGMLFVLLFGAQGVCGAWLMDHHVKIVFAVPGIVLATTFVTFPYVARELIPTMLVMGSDEEQAALTLGAGGWRTFFRITLPNVKWSLLYGVILCNARAMGEFGAVSVVSGHIRGLTNTMPLYVEILYNDYQFAPAFAVASLLAMLALVTLVARSIVEWKSLRDLEAASAMGVGKPDEH
jgi:sulfate transport system permease protein